MTNTAEDDALRCEAPGCRATAVKTVPDAGLRPTFWRVCSEHLAIVKGRRP